MGNLNYQDVIRDVHDSANHALQISGTISAAGQATVTVLGLPTVTISNPTLYAVVNTGAVGVGNSIVTVANPNFGINAGVNGIGFATVNVVNQPALVAGTANIGSVSILGGVVNSNLNAGVNSIGFASVTPVQAWPDPKTYIGLTTATIGNNPILGASPSFIGIVTVTNQRPLVASTVNIGSVSVLGGRIGLNAGVNGIGFTTVKVDAGTQFIGLVTAWTRNAGTSKTLVSLPVGLGNNSLATVAVPTNANKINLTQLILNSNVTTEIAIKSGVTYLTGNASLGITLFPGGGFVMNGSPDSPAWISLPSGAMVVEKRDGGGTVSKIGGSVIYFDE